MNPSLKKFYDFEQQLIHHNLLQPYQKQGGEILGRILIEKNENDFIVSFDFFEQTLQIQNQPDYPYQVIGEVDPDGDSPEEWAQQIIEELQDNDITPKYIFIFEHGDLVLTQDILDE